MSAARRIEIESTHNFRDVGGYPTTDGGSTRWGVLYRSESLDGLTATGLQQLCDLGIRTSLDVRNDAEVARSPSPLASDSGFNYFHRRLPMRLEEDDARPESPLEMALLYLESRKPFIKEIIEIVAATDRMPLIVSCTGGKDRTGVVIALLLGLAHVTPEAIAGDYALTAHYAGPVLERWIEESVERGRDRAEVTDSLHAHRR